MTDYIFIKDFHVGDKISQSFLISSVKAGTTKKGDPFTTMVFQDASGRITCKKWQFNLADYPEIKAGTWVTCNILVEDYMGSIQAKCLTTPMPVTPSAENISRYKNDLGVSTDQALAFYQGLMEFKNQVEDPYIKAYLDTIFEDNQVIQKLFQIAPASVSNRGAYRGGLVEHVYKVMLNAMAIVDAQSKAHNSPKINRDIVIAGVLAHDLGKMYAYHVDITGVSHTRSGLLHGHLSLSYSISIQAFIQTESAIHREVPEEIKDHINHCILAHHGLLEYGSPVKPQSVEAQIVHVADMADSTTSNFAEVSMAGQQRRDENGFVLGNYFTAKSVYIDHQESDD